MKVGVFAFLEDSGVENFDTFVFLLGVGRGAIVSALTANGAFLAEVATLVADAGGSSFFTLFVKAVLVSAVFALASSFSPSEESSSLFELVAELDRRVAPPIFVSENKLCKPRFRFTTELAWFCPNDVLETERPFL